jgi:hypothetical protein
MMARRPVLTTVALAVAAARKQVSKRAPGGDLYLQRLR